MVSAKILIALIVLPIAIYGYTCHLSDTSVNTVYNECTTGTFCTKTIEYDSNNREVKTRRGCDSGMCQTNGQYNTNKNYDGSWSTVNCCTGDMCNSATNKGLLALPLMLITYVLFK